MKPFANQSSIRITSSTWTSQKTVSENSVWPSIYRSCPQLLPKILVQFQVRTRILSKITRNSVKTIRIVNPYRVMSTYELSETITRRLGTIPEHFCWVSTSFLILCEIFAKCSIHGFPPTLSNFVGQICSISDYDESTFSCGLKRLNRA